MEAAYLIVLILAGIALSGIGIGLGNLVAPSSPHPQKTDPYECGVEPLGDAWMQFKVSYYLFALAFLIFALEVIYIFPWTVVLEEIGFVAVIEVFIFLFLLFLGLLFAWKKGALQWD